MPERPGGALPVSPPAYTECAPLERSGLRAGPPPRQPGESRKKCFFTLPGPFSAKNGVPLPADAGSGFAHLRERLHGHAAPPTSAHAQQGDAHALRLPFRNVSRRLHLRSGIPSSKKNRIRRTAMKQHAITLAHGTYTELKDTEGAYYPCRRLPCAKG